MTHDAEETSWVVVQWPIKSSGGTKRDRWLVDRATEHIDQYLHEFGLGAVDGHDKGQRSAGGGFVLNLFCRVIDANRAATSNRTCLRKAGLDLTRASIAVMETGAETYTVRYERVSNKLPGPFAL